MNVLFIGNSYTYYNDMPLLFERLANSNHKNVTVFSITQGGRQLESYTDTSAATTMALDALLERQTFDVCFILRKRAFEKRKHIASRASGLTRTKYATRVGAYEVFS